jgi:SWI/SNF-related matrix-associated actin-dependent regulator of chromatin subfamily A3
MSTKLFQAVKKISSQFRWCLSGTPIQNSLEDLASLVAFIRVSPLDSLPEFRKHIITPLLKNTGLGAEALRCLLDSVCLRRTKKLLNLPDDNYECREVEFSASERILYTTTEREMVKVVKEQVHQPRSVKRDFGIFQLWLRLRRICNHGTFQKPFSLAPGDAVQFDAEKALALQRQREDAKCIYCSAEVSGLHGEMDERIGHSTACGNLMCSECVPRYMTDLRKNEAGRGFQCPLCLQNVLRSCLLPKKRTEKDSTGRNITTGDYFQADGFSSKVSALASDIEQNSTGRKGYVEVCHFNVA